MKLEYVIWGIPAGQQDEQLLLTALDGKTITARPDAEHAARYITRAYGASKCRIQAVEINSMDWRSIVAAAI
jgi:hypothetical protein